MDFDDDFEAVPKRRRIGGGNSGGGRASDDAFVMIDLCASEDEDEAGGGGGGGGAAPAKQPNLLFEGGVEIVGESRSSARPSSARVVFRRARHLPLLLCACRQARAAASSSRADRARRGSRSCVGAPSAGHTQRFLC